MCEQINRSGQGYLGSTYPEDSRVRTGQWLGDWATSETSLRRRPAGQRRITLSYPAQAGAGGWIKLEWKLSENNRRAKFYSLTRLGRKELERAAANWNRLSTAITRVVKLFSKGRGPEVAIINQTMARQYFGTANPLGKRLGFSKPGYTI
jgi:hypothetical protein